FEKIRGAVMSEEMLSAIRNDDANRVTQILNAGFPIDTIIRTYVDIQTIEGSAGKTLEITAIDFAVAVESNRSVEVLLSAGASPDYPGSEFPALFWAAFHNQDFLLDRLIALGASPHRKVKDSITPAMVAAARVS